MNIFEQASRQKLRFETHRGILSVEDLWDLKLQSRDGFDLDTLARKTNHQLRELTEESFVETSVNPAKVTLELKLEILKHIIQVKLEERDAKTKAAERAVERQRLLEALEQKKGEELNALSAEEIQKRILALNN